MNSWTVRNMCLFSGSRRSKLPYSSPLLASPLPTYRRRRRREPNHFFSFFFCISRNESLNVENVFVFFFFFFLYCSDLIDVSQKVNLKNKKIKMKMLFRRSAVHLRFSKKNISRFAVVVFCLFLLLLLFFSSSSSSSLSLSLHKL